MKNKICYFGAAICILLSLSSCHKEQINPDWKNENGEPTVLRGSQNPETAVCVHEKGVFFISSSTLCYYDYDSGDSYVLCSKPNCMHENNECVAYAGNNATGFALYGDHAFYFRPKEDSQAWELVRINIQEQYSEVLTEIGADGDEMGQWIVSGITDSYYYGGKVWLHMNLTYQSVEEDWWNSAGTQLAAIDLSTSEFYEVTEIYETNTSHWNMSYQSFNDTYVGYNVMAIQPEIMLPEEYAESKGVSPDALSEEEYWEYVNQNRVEENLVLDSRIIDLNSMESFSVFQDRGEKCLGEGIYWTDDTHAYVAEWISDDASDGGNIISINLQNGNKEEVLRLENGGCLAWYMGELSLDRYNGEDILYLEYDGEDKCRIYKYSPAQQTSEFLFEDEASVSFRIVGQTRERLVGKFGEDTQYAWIDKKEYEQGNLKAAKKFRLF